MTPGQKWQTFISTGFTLIYLMILAGLVVIGKISVSYIIDNLLALIYVGLIFILIAPVYRQTEHIIDKIIKQIGVYSTVLLLMSAFIWLAEAGGFITPEGTLEMLVFSVASRIAFIGILPVLFFLLVGQVDWENIVDRNDGR